jgi:16S rRNA (uracil1498-N3)-methyltransferase
VSRFHVSATAVSGDRVTFDAAEAHHLARVLRLGVGETVRAVDGSGRELIVRLTRVDARSAEGDVVERVTRPTESPLDLTLAQAIPKGDKLETVIRMATELGVSRVVPLITERTGARAEPGRWAHRLARCQRVAREAAKQSGRVVIPDVEPPRTLGAWLGGHPVTGVLLCVWEGAREGLSRVLPDGAIDRITVVVGPEGGLGEGEVAQLRAAGAVIAGLGPRVLRTETAGPVVLALLQARYGDLGRPAAPAPA